MIPSADNKSSAVWVARTMMAPVHLLKSSGGTLSKDGLLVSWLLFVWLGFFLGWPRSCLSSGSLSGSCGSSLATSSTFAACAAAKLVFEFLFVSVIILRSLSGISSSSPQSSATFLWRRDGATVALKSLSLSLSRYLGDVSSCQWLVKAAHDHSMRWSNSTWTAFLKVMS